MKYLAPLLILFVLNFSVLNAQNQQKIDSLTQDLATVTTDIDRIDLYNKISNEYKRTDSFDTQYSPARARVVNT